MRRFRQALLLLLVLMIAACTSRQGYDIMRSAQQSECLKGPRSQYAECMERANQGYGDYKRDRDEVLER